MTQPDNLRDYLIPTSIIDSNHTTIVELAASILGRINDPIDRAIKLFLAVRDSIRYDPYSPFYLPEHYRASNVVKRGRSFCVPKASVLCALGRASGIPSRIGFATVRNHLATRQLIDFLGSDLFVYHGFVEFYLEGKWVKATPAFNRELCERNQVEPLEFNGREDALFQLYNSRQQKFMEYLEYTGTYPDIPVSSIVDGWEKAYGKDRVRRWIRMFEERGGISLADFDREDLLQDEEVPR
jgi:transglutaminase-like putative cysteine protease